MYIYKASAQSLVLVKKEPIEETLPSTAVYSTSTCIYIYNYILERIMFYMPIQYPIHTAVAGLVKTETEVELESPLALVQPPGVIMETPPQLTGTVYVGSYAVCTINGCPFEIGRW